MWLFFITHDNCKAEKEINQSGWKTVLPQVEKKLFSSVKVIINVLIFVLY